mgnify:FL=1
MASRLLYDLIEDQDDDASIAGVAQCLYYYNNEPVYDFQVMNRLSFTGCGTEYNDCSVEDSFNYFKETIALLVRRGLVDVIKETENLFKYKLSDTGLDAVKTYCRIP